MEVIPSEYYTVFISDSLSDGLCCNWGEGYFKLFKFNESLYEELIMEGTDFKNYKHLCIPRSHSYNLNKNVIEMLKDPNVVMMIYQLQQE